MSSRPFVHLHCHSHYSLLDGASKIPDLFDRAKALGMPALALTDHGNLYGAVEFLREAKEAGVLPIVTSNRPRQKSAMSAQDVRMEKSDVAALVGTISNGSATAGFALMHAQPCAHAKSKSPSAW